MSRKVDETYFFFGIINETFIFSLCMMFNNLLKVLHTHSGTKSQQL